MKAEIKLSPVPVNTSWCVDDIKGNLPVEHITDEEIQAELDNLAKAFQEMCIQSGWDVIYNCFNVKEKEGNTK